MFKYAASTLLYIVLIINQRQMSASTAALRQDQHPIDVACSEDSLIWVFELEPFKYQMVLATQMVFLTGELHGVLLMSDIFRMVTN